MRDIQRTDPRIPVTIITGSLRAGNTKLLNHTLGLSFRASIS